MGIKNFHSENYSGYVAFQDDKTYIVKIYKRIHKLFDKGLLKNGDQILDIGFADGSLSAKLKSDFGFKSYGIDISEGAIEKAKAKGIDAQVHDLEYSFPFEDGKFQLIIAAEVIEHLFDTDKFVQELYDALAKGGQLMITTPNLCSFINRVRILFGAYPLFVPEYNSGPLTAGHIRAYTVEKLEGQLREHGFVIIKTSAPNIPFPMASNKVPKFLKRIAERLGEYFPTLGSHIIIHAYKPGA